MYKQIAIVNTTGERKEDDIEVMEDAIIKDIDQNNGNYNSDVLVSCILI